MSWESLQPTSGPKVASHLASYGTIYLLPIPPVADQPQAYWMVGAYNVLQPLAEKLRGNQTLRDILTAYRVRLGLRVGDVPPVSPDQQSSYGTNVTATTAGQTHTGERKPSAYQTVTEINALVAAHTGKTARINPGSGHTERITDLLENKYTYWEKKTPEAHHIVEFTQLEALGVSRATGNGPFDHAELPCVLLAAEFHQRFITRILEQARAKAKTLPGLTEKRAYLKTLREVYSTLYKRNGTLFLPLWDAAQTILNAAEPRLNP